MKFYKNTDGQWVLDSGIIPAGSCRYTLTGSGFLTIYLLNGFALYKGKLTELQKEDGSFYEDEEDFLTDCASFFVNSSSELSSLNLFLEEIERIKAEKEDTANKQDSLDVDGTGVKFPTVDAVNTELSPMKTDISDMKEDIASLEGGYLGSIEYDDVAPTPGKSGYYDFSTSGVVSWLDNKEVEVGDKVSVLFDDPTYTYTLIQIADSLSLKANHGYGVGETPKTLKEVEGEIIKEPIVSNAEHATADALNYLLGRIQALEEFIQAKQYGEIQVDKITALNEINLNGADMHLEGEGVPSFAPDRLHQRYIDISSKIAYTAVGVSNSADWKRDTV